MTFYTYQYLRAKDGSPYYVGKGKGKRAWESRAGHRPPRDPSRVRIQCWHDEATALAYEIYLIDFWGRKDLGTGCLRNLTDGGEGTSGARRPHLAQWNRDNLRGKTGPDHPTFGLKRPDLARWNSTNLKGKKIGAPSEEHRRKISEEKLQWWSSLTQQKREAISNAASLKELNRLTAKRKEEV